MFNRGLLSLLLLIPLVVACNELRPPDNTPAVTPTIEAVAVQTPVERTPTPPTLEARPSPTATSTATPTSTLTPTPTATARPTPGPPPGPPPGFGSPPGPPPAAQGIPPLGPQITPTAVPSSASRPSLAVSIESFEVENNVYIPRFPTYTVSPDPGNQFLLVRLRTLYLFPPDTSQTQPFAYTIVVRGFLNEAPLKGVPANRFYDVPTLDTTDTTPPKTKTSYRPQSATREIAAFEIPAGEDVSKIRITIEMAWSERESTSVNLSLSP